MLNLWTLTPSRLKAPNYFGKPCHISALLLVQLRSSGGNCRTSGKLFTPSLAMTRSNATSPEWLLLSWCDRSQCTRENPPWSSRQAHSIALGLAAMLTHSDCSNRNDETFGQVCSIIKTCPSPTIYCLLCWLVIGNQGSMLASNVLEIETHGDKCAKEINTSCNCTCYHKCMECCTKAKRCQHFVSAFTLLLFCWPC